MMVIATLLGTHVFVINENEFNFCFLLTDISVVFKQILQVNNSF